MVETVEMLVSWGGKFYVKNERSWRVLWGDGEEIDLVELDFGRLSYTNTHSHTLTHSHTHTLILTLILTQLQCLCFLFWLIFLWAHSFCVLERLDYLYLMLALLGKERGGCLGVWCLVHWMFSLFAARAFMGICAAFFLCRDSILCLVILIHARIKL
jgi:hypothetical protein